MLIMVSTLHSFYLYFNIELHKTFFKMTLSRINVLILNYRYQLDYFNTEDILKAAPIVAHRDKSTENYH